MTAKEALFQEMRWAEDATPLNNIPTEDGIMDWLGKIGGGSKKTPSGALLSVSPSPKSNPMLSPEEELKKHDRSSHPDGYKGGRCSIRGKLAEKGFDVRGYDTKVNKFTAPENYDYNAEHEEKNKEGEESVAETEVKEPEEKKTSELLPTPEKVSVAGRDIEVQNQDQAAALALMKEVLETPNVSQEVLDKVKAQLDAIEAQTMQQHPWGKPITDEEYDALKNDPDFQAAREEWKRQLMMGGEYDMSHLTPDSASARLFNELVDELGAEGQKIVDNTPSVGEAPAVSEEPKPTVEPESPAEVPKEETPTPKEPEAEEIIDIEFDKPEAPAETTPAPEKSPTSESSASSTMDPKSTTTPILRERPGLVERIKSRVGRFLDAIEAKLAQLSGEAEQLEKVLDKWEQDPNVSKDRSEVRENLKKDMEDKVIHSASYYVGEQIDKLLASEKVEPEIKGILNSIKQNLSNWDISDEQLRKEYQYYHTMKEKYGLDDILRGEGDTGTQEAYSPENLTIFDKKYTGPIAGNDLLDPPSDKVRQEEMIKSAAETITERFTIHGIEIGELKSASEGPSQVVLTFAIPKDFKLSSATSADTIAALSQGLGVPVQDVKLGDEADTLKVTFASPKPREVRMADIINSDEWKSKSKDMAIPNAVGIDAEGNIVVKDAAEAPHEKVFGATKSGKSVYLQAKIAAPKLVKTPQQWKQILVDPKKLEFNSEVGSPYNWCPVQFTAQGTANMLQRLVQEMEDRASKLGVNLKAYNELTGEGDINPNASKNLQSYNKNHPGEEVPYISLVIDEVHALTKDPTYGPQIIDSLDQLLAKARAVGINITLATQRGDVESLPGRLQANAPAVTEFRGAPNDAKASKAAKGLKNPGDFIHTDQKGETITGRGIYLKDHEIRNINDFYKSNAAATGEGSLSENESAQEPTAVGKETAEQAAERIGESDAEKSGLKKVAERIGSGNLTPMRVPAANADKVKALLESQGIGFTEEKGADGKVIIRPKPTGVGQEAKPNEPPEGTSSPEGNNAPESSAGTVSTESSSISNIKTADLSNKGLKSNFPVQKDLGDGKLEIPIGNFTAYRGYDWQGQPDNIDINDLDAINEAGRELHVDKDGIADWTKAKSSVVKLGNGKVAIFVNQNTGQGFDQAGRQSQLSRVAFVDEETANKYGDQIAQHLMNMPIPAKGNDPSLKENKTVFTPTKPEETSAQAGTATVTSNGSGVSEVGSEGDANPEKGYTTAPQTTEQNPYLSQEELSNIQDDDVKTELAFYSGKLQEAFNNKRAAVAKGDEKAIDAANAEIGRRLAQVNELREGTGLPSLNERGKRPMPEPNATPAEEDVAVEENAVEAQGGEQPETAPNSYWDEKDTENIKNRFVRQELKDNADNLNAAVQEYDGAKDADSRAKALSKIEKIITSDNKRRKALGLRQRDDEGNLVNDNGEQEKGVEEPQQGTQTTEPVQGNESAAPTQGQESSEASGYDTSHLSEDDKFEFETEQAHHDSAIKKIRDQYVKGKITRQEYKQQMADANKEFDTIKKEFGINAPQNEGTGPVSATEVPQEGGENPGNEKGSEPPEDGESNGGEEGGESPTTGSGVPKSPRNPDYPVDAGEVSAENNEERNENPSDFSLISSTPEEIQQEKDKIKQRDTIARRQQSPLKGGKDDGANTPLGSQGVGGQMDLFEQQQPAEQQKDAETSVEKSQTEQAQTSENIERNKVGQKPSESTQEVQGSSESGEQDLEPSSAPSEQTEVSQLPEVDNHIKSAIQKAGLQESVAKEIQDADNVKAVIQKLNEAKEKNGENSDEYKKALRQMKSTVTRMANAIKGRDEGMDVIKETDLGTSNNRQENEASKDTSAKTNNESQPEERAESSENNINQEESKPLAEMSAEEIQSAIDNLDKDGKMEPSEYKKALKPLKEELKKRQADGGRGQESNETLSAKKNQDTTEQPAAEQSPILGEEVVSSTLEAKEEEPAKSEPDVSPYITAAIEKAGIKPDAAAEIQSDKGIQAAMKALEDVKSNNGEDSAEYKKAEKNLKSKLTHMANAIRNRNDNKEVGEESEELQTDVNKVDAAAGTQTSVKATPASNSPAQEQRGSEKNTVAGEKARKDIAAHVSKGTISLEDIGVKDINELSDADATKYAKAAEEYNAENEKLDEARREYNKIDKEIKQATKALKTSKGTEEEKAAQKDHIEELKDKRDAWEDVRIDAEINAQEAYDKLSEVESSIRGRNGNTAEKPSVKAEISSELKSQIDNDKSVGYIKGVLEQLENEGKKSSKEYQETKQLLDTEIKRVKTNAITRLYEDDLKPEYEKDENGKQKRKESWVNKNLALEMVEAVENKNPSILINKLSSPISIPKEGVYKPTEGKASRKAFEMLTGIKIPDLTQEDVGNGKASEHRLGKLYKNKVSEIVRQFCAQKGEKKASPAKGNQIPTQVASQPTANPSEPISKPEQQPAAEKKQNTQNPYNKTTSVSGGTHANLNAQSDKVLAEAKKKAKNLKTPGVNALAALSAPTGKITQESAQSINQQLQTISKELQGLESALNNREEVANASKKQITSTLGLIEYLREGLEDIYKSQRLGKGNFTFKIENKGGRLSGLSIDRFRGADGQMKSIEAPKEVKSDFSQMSKKDKIAAVRDIISTETKGSPNRGTEKEIGEAAKSLVDAIVEKNADALAEKLRISNPAERKAFEEMTGEKLPSGVKDTLEAIDKFCGITPEKRDEINKKKADARAQSAAKIKADAESKNQAEENKKIKEAKEKDKQSKAFYASISEPLPFGTEEGYGTLKDMLDDGYRFQEVDTEDGKKTWALFKGDSGDGYEMDKETRKLFGTDAKFNQIVAGAQQYTDLLDRKGDFKNISFGSQHSKMIEEENAKIEEILNNINKKKKGKGSKGGTKDEALPGFEDLFSDPQRDATWVEIFDGALSSFLNN